MSLSDRLEASETGGALSPYPKRSRRAVRVATEAPYRPRGGAPKGSPRTSSTWRKGIESPNKGNFRFNHDQELQIVAMYRDEGLTKAEIIRQLRSSDALISRILAKHMTAEEMALARANRDTNAKGAGMTEAWIANRNLRRDNSNLRSRAKRYERHNDLLRRALLHLGHNPDSITDEASLLEWISETVIPPM